jgi:hypothetical protein
MNGSLRHHKSFHNSGSSRATIAGGHRITNIGQDTNRASLNGEFGRPPDMRRHVRRYTRRRAAAISGQR